MIGEKKSVMDLYNLHLMAEMAFSLSMLKVWMAELAYLSRCYNTILQFTVKANRPPPPKLLKLHPHPASCARSQTATDLTVRIYCSPPKLIPCWPVEHLCLRVAIQTHREHFKNARYMPRSATNGIQTWQTFISSAESKSYIWLKKN